MKPKDWGIKKETKVDAYISDNFSHISTNFVPPKMQIFLAFHRDALYYCVFIMRETPAILAKLVRNWNVQFSSNFTNFSTNNFTNFSEVIVILTKCFYSKKLSNALNFNIFSLVYLNYSEIGELFTK